MSCPYGSCISPFVCSEARVCQHEDRPQNLMNRLAQKRDDIRRRLEEKVLDTVAGPPVDDEVEGHLGPLTGRERVGFDPDGEVNIIDGCRVIDATQIEPLTPAEYPTLMREFETGATRNVDDDNLDYEGFLSPLVLQRFAEYMHSHRRQADGTVRASDNWQKGIPFDSYMKSGFRHFMDWWLNHRGLEGRDDVETALCALLFNVQGYLHEHLKAK